MARKKVEATVTAPKTKERVNNTVKKAGKLEKNTKNRRKKSTAEKETVETEFPATIFDNVYHTIVTRMPQLIVPVINDAFKTRYPKDVKIEQLRNEFYRKNGKIVTDSIFLIEGHLYHIECQSNPDNTMAIRMFEYGFEIGLDRARQTKDYLHVQLPESAVLYLRHNANTPDVLMVEVSTPQGESVTYESKVIKVQNYTRDVIFRKKLLLFLPYYIMRYENELDEIEKDPARVKKLLKEYQGICDKLEKVLEEDGESELYTNLIGLIVKISDYMLREQKNTRKEMNKMGGQVLELYTDKVEKKVEKRLAEAIKDIANGVKSSELKKKYSADTIKIAKESIKIAKTIA